jgi:hypothetical protein
MGVACRMEIMACHKLERDHFDTMKKFLEAADVMVSALKAAFPSIEVKHPDILVPGQPLLDQFWYYTDHGTMASLRDSHTHMLQLSMLLYICTYMKL